MNIWCCLHRTEKVIFKYVLQDVCLLQIPRQGKKQKQHLLNACRWWVRLLTDFTVDKCLCKFFPSFQPVFHRCVQFYFNQCISANFLLNLAGVMGLCFKSLYRRDLLHSLALPWTSLGNIVGVSVFSIELINVSVLEGTELFKILELCSYINKHRLFPQIQVAIFSSSQELKFLCGT